jgi:hypothetical protein
MNPKIVTVCLAWTISLAQAVTITVGGSPVASQGRVSSVAGATTIDFNGLSNGGPQTYISGIAAYSNLFIRSAGGTDIAGDTSPFSSAPNTLGDLTINFSQPIIYFGLYWGSPDPQNVIAFYNGSSPNAFSFTGQNLHDQFGVPFGSGNAVYVNFRADPGEQATRVVISANGSFPFEQDNHAFLAVPEASPALMLASGLMLLAIGWRRRKRS